MGACSATAVQEGVAFPFVIPTRISCQAALDGATCAPFREERRMKCINAMNLNRKSGGAQPRDLQFSGRFLGMLFDSPQGDLMELLCLRNAPRPAILDGWDACALGASQNPPGFHPTREEYLKGFTPVLMIRLARFGARKQPYYRVVVIEKDRARNGRSIEVVGTYNPRTQPATVQLKRERIEHWTSNGAQLSERVAKLLAAPSAPATAA
jgi:small subunit ribosomal protein S16